MKIPDLRKLHHAWLLSETGSYVRTAEKLHLSQSALSRSIQALEQELGFPVFHRGRRGIHATPAGQEILARTQPLLQQAGALQQEIESRRDTRDSQITFGVGPAMPSLFLPALLLQLHRSRPALSIDVTVESPPRLIELLQNGALDFFIADQRYLSGFNAERFEVRELTGITLAFFVRRNHPLTGTRISPAALDRYTLISPQYKIPGHDAALQGEGGGVSRILCNDLETLRRLVLETDAVLLGLKPMVLRELVRGEIRQLAIDDPRLRDPAHIALVSLAGSCSATASSIAGMIRQLLDV